ncbi:MAG: hypothetical protein C5B50_26765 [Verrucomicrobia bacterium]|nr:MAG: hypothetical protein C5B50_26765 [Verrucomicrobiota bacterium]
MDAAPDPSPDSTLNPEPSRFADQPALLCRLLVYIVAPLLTGLLVSSRGLHGDGVYPIDNGDEPAETFIEVPMAQHCLASGDILKINLFNNFGTPLLGDPVAYPYALHAWTYARFRPVVAMMINKFALSTLTMLVLTLFFRRYFGPLISSFCAFLAFSSPAFFYFMNNHPHQGALFYFCLVLLSLRWLLDSSGRSASSSFSNPSSPDSLTHSPTFPRSVRRSLLTPLCVYAAFLVFLVSVGINGALFGLCFIGAYAVLVTLARRHSPLSPRAPSAGRQSERQSARRSGRKGVVSNPRSMVWAFVLFLAAFIAVHPHFLEFFRLAAQSSRKNFDYQHWLVTPPWQLLKGLFVWAGEDQHIFAATYYSIPVSLFVVAGIGLTWLQSRAGIPPAPNVVAEGRRDACPALKEQSLLMLVLGLLPLVGVLFLRLFPDLAAKVPLMRSVNLTRILWFSDIFLMLAVGVAISAIAGLLFGASSTVRLVRPVRPVRLICQAAFLAAIGVTIFFRAQVLHELANWFLVSEPLTGFQPPELLDEMKPYTRLAAAVDPVPWGHEAKAASHNVVGSSARAITSNETLRNYLAQRSLIQEGYAGMTWFFRPSSPNLLAPYGIRYFIAPTLDEQMKQWGWKIVDIKTAPHPLDMRLVLYESPLNATPFNFVSKGFDFLQDYTISGNEMRLKIPANRGGSTLIATFLYQPGWKVYADGQPVTIKAWGEIFVSFRVPPANKEQAVLLKYEPYTNAYLIGSVIVSLIAGAFVCWFHGRCSKSLFG